MADLDPISFECIGCGTLNPADAATCAGCGHSFAGLTSDSPAAPIPRNPYSQPPAESPHANQRVEPARFSNPEPAPGPGRILFQFVSWLAIIFLGAFASVSCFVLSLMIAVATVCGTGRDPTFVGVGIGLIVLFAGAVAAIQVIHRLVTRTRSEEPIRSRGPRFKSRRDL